MEAKKENKDGIDGLMRKTKAQLCEIISRKDDVESKHCAEIKRLTAELTQTKAQLDAAIKDCKGTTECLHSLEAKMKLGMDEAKKMKEAYRANFNEAVSKLEERNNTIREQRIAIITLIVIIVGVFGTLALL